MLNCEQCESEFEITDRDQEVFQRFKIPEPSFCLACRQQCRMAWRNDRTLYSRSCDMCQKSIVALYPQDSVHKVYCNECWWSDQNDGLEFGQQFDFDHSFFKQFGDLVQKVPRINLTASNNENCDYVNNTNYSKDCYLCFGSHNSEKCCYCWRTHHCLECYDCSQLNDCQFCYECLDCDDSYQLFFSQNCQNCSNSAYLFACRSVKDSFMCSNLVNKQYCIKNQEYNKEEYQEILRDFKKKSRQELRREFEDFLSKQPHRALNIINCQNCSGDYLLNCKNCENSFSAKDCEDCKDIYLCEKAKDCYDSDITGWPAELCYGCISVAVNARNNLFCNTSWSCSDITYCDSCFNSKDLFGCVGLKGKQYCILNKQYNKEEYQELHSKIIQFMSVRGEWGRSFPIKYSPFAYNESFAFENYPVSKDECAKRGWKWYEADESNFSNLKSIKAEEIPENIEEVSDDIVDRAIVCKETAKPYRILSNELEFLRKFNLPIPHFHPDQRHLQRMKLRNPRKLFDGKCDKCEASIQTSYKPQDGAIVYCEECYLGEVY